MKLTISLFLFIAFTTINAEFILNRQSSTIAFYGFILIEAILIYLFIYPFIKKLLKK